VHQLHKVLIKSWIEAKQEELETRVKDLYKSRERKRAMINEAFVAKSRKERTGAVERLPNFIN